MLITGESGVGKEVVAQLIHHHSRRAQHPLVTINCAGVPDTLLASELFGHLRGSFTGAYANKLGWLEKADHGTIFMDEVGEMSLQMQGLLLRFFENGEIQPIGATQRRTAVDVRVITATNRRLIDRVEAREFREDLYYRLNVIHIDIPPLRERPEDVSVLLDHFLSQLSTHHRVAVPRLSDAVLSHLTGHSWPGNARQLRNVVERLVIRARGREIGVGDLPRDVLSSQSVPQATPGEPEKTRAERLFEQLLRGESFWTAVHQPFLLHDVTREDVRVTVRRGLEMSDHNYKTLLTLFNMPPEHYKRLMTFLRKFQLEPSSAQTEVRRTLVDVRQTASARRVGEGN